MDSTEKLFKFSHPPWADTDYLGAYQALINKKSLLIRWKQNKKTSETGAPIPPGADSAEALGSPSSAHLPVRQTGLWEIKKRLLNEKALSVLFV